MHSKPLLLAGVLVAGIHMPAADPVPAEVWALKEDPAKGIMGAIVLEKRLAFRPTCIEVTYRVRVLSEAGKAALDLRPFSEDCYAFEGRVVHRDGRTIKLEGRKDFQEQTITSGDDRQTNKVVRIPGLSADCVVELAWKEKASPLPNNAPAFTWRMDGPWFTQTSVVDIMRTIPLAHAFRGLKSQPHIEDGPRRIVTVSNLAAVPDEPFGLNTGSRTCLEIYDVPDFLKKAVQVQDMKRFWDIAGQSVFQEFINIKRGRTYRKLMEELQAGLPAGPQDRARELCARLQARIQNLDALTVAEAAQRAKDPIRRLSENVDWTATKGATTGMGMNLILFAMLEDMGMKPRLAFVSDREEALLDVSLSSIWQWSDILVVVDEPGKPRLFLDPSLRLAPAGMVLPRYTASKVLEFDPAAKKLQVVEIPVANSEESVRKFDCDVKVDAEGVAFKVKGVFTGYQAVLEREHYWKNDEASQRKELQKTLQERLKGSVVSGATLQGVLDSRAPLKWEAEGQVAMEGGRKLVITPFPLVDAPVWLPTSWPETRKTPILLSHARKHAVTSRVTLPAGYQAQLPAPLSFKNRFGSVAWQSERQPDGQILVSLDINLDTVTGYNWQQADLRAFLSAVEEAQGRTLVAERS